MKQPLTIYLCPLLTVFFMANAKADSSGAPAGEPPADNAHPLISIIVITQEHEEQCPDCVPIDTLQKGISIDGHKEFNFEEPNFFYPLEDSSAQPSLFPPDNAERENIHTQPPDPSYRIITTEELDIFLTGGAKEDENSQHSEVNNQGLQEASLQPDGADTNLLTQTEHAPPKEEVTNYEVGIQVEDNNYILNIAAFQTQLEDNNIKWGDHFTLLRGDQVVYSIPESQRKRMDIQGVDVQADFSIGLLSGKAQYIYTHLESAEQLQTRLNETHIGALEVDYPVTSQITLGMTITHRQDIMDKTLPKNERTNTLNIYSLYDLNSNVQMGVILKNITDSKHGHHHPIIRGERRTLLFTIRFLPF